MEANNRPERLDLRSYARQGSDQIPTVRRGPAVCQMEKKEIQTNIGNLNRDIKTANLDLCQYFGHKKLKVYADFLNSSSSFCYGVI
ncbi:MobA/MobL family protein [Lachnospiraceae bacterium 45-W7]